MAKSIILYLVAFLALTESYGSALSADEMQVYEAYKSVYYDPVTNLTLKSVIEDSGRLPHTRIGFRSLPCACQDSSCGCCAGINITTIKFNQKACTNFTYDPYDFAIKMEVAMNDKNVFTNKISAKNPPPICMPFPPLPVINLCIKFYNVFMPGNNLHACIDFETKFAQSPILVLHFDCVRLGADGIAWLKPEDNGDIDQSDNDDFGSPQIAEPEIYDEVNFESNDSEVQAANVTNSSLSIEEEDNIGQLKL